MGPEASGAGGDSPPVVSGVTVHLAGRAVGSEGPGRPRSPYSSLLVLWEFWGAGASSHDASAALGTDAILRRRQRENHKRTELLEEPVVYYKLR